jgi:hypothetical protein
MAQASTPTATIELRLRSLQQLFHSLDPSPFRDRDLDKDAATFIIESLQDLPSAATAELVLRLQESASSTSTASTSTASASVAAIVPIDPSHLQVAVRNYFAICRQSTERELRELLRLGRRALILGLAVVTVTIAGIEFIRAQLAPGTVGAGVLESMVIVSWVALWRPTEILLYDWMPLRRRIKLFRRLEAMPVRIVPDPVGEGALADPSASRALPE